MLSWKLWPAQREMDYMNRDIIRIRGNLY